MPAMLHGRFLVPIVALAAVAIPTFAKAQADPYLGPFVGVFFPNDSDLRDEMGNSWFSFGASRVRIDKYQEQNIGYDWNAFSQSKSGNKVFMVAGTIGITRPFGRPGDASRPYVAIRGGLSYIDYAVGTPSGGGGGGEGVPAALADRVSGKRIGFNANVEVGVNVGERLNLAVRYDLMPTYDGLSFSGLSLALKYGIARF